MTTTTAPGGRGRILVVGAGIAGLTAAYRAQEAGFDVTVLEAAPAPGGRMSTIHRDGFVIDTGAGWLVDKYDAMQRLAEDLGVADELVPTSDLMGFVVDGVVHRMRSSSKLDAVRLPLLSPRGKLSAAKLMLDARRASAQLDPSDLSLGEAYDTETVLQYAARRGLRDEVVQRLVDPTVRASLQNTVGEMTIVDLFFMLGKFWGGGFMNSLSGIDFLVQALAARLDVRVNCRVTSVDQSADGVVLRWSAGGESAHIEPADGCVIALSGRQMLAVNPGLEPERRTIIEQLEYAPIISVHMALRSEPAERAMYIQVPTSQDPDLIAVGLDHRKSPGRAPVGKGLVVSYWTPEWCRAHWDDDDERILAHAVGPVERVVPGVSDNVEFVNVSRHDPGIMLSRVGTWKAMRRFHRLSGAEDRIAYAGDYLGGTSTNSALASGEQAVKTLLARVPLVRDVKHI